MIGYMENGRLVKRAYWLIKLRWLATAAVAVCTFISYRILGIHLVENALYSIAGLLAIYNAVVYFLLGYFCRDHKNISYSAVNKTIHFQISADLLILTLLLHFSGGIENPFVFYFTFHMIIASILLSMRESYLQATFAVLLFGFLVLLEYLELIPHHCLRGFVTNCQYHDGIYILGTYFVFTSTVFLVVFMTSDISMRLKLAEQAQRLANKQLLEKDRIKDEYVYRVSHDVKGHVASIQSCLDVLKDGFTGPLNELQADFVKRAHQRTNKLLTFVRALLQMTQMRLSKSLEMETFSLKNTINNAITTVKEQAQLKSIALQSCLELSEDTINGNQISVEEMIVNLLLNAIKYTPTMGKIEIVAREDDPNITVEIRDTGIGIPKEELPKVFNEFYRATNARKIERDGTGLGLSIAKQIIERHHGKIKVESEEGVGSSFIFTFPKANCTKFVDEVLVK